jgi:hypothetical protein
LALNNGISSRTYVVNSPYLNAAEDEAIQTLACSPKTGRANKGDSG